MSLQPALLRAALARAPRVVRVVVASVQGSAPREVGAAMLVWADGQAGTIGGGALEYQAVAAARAQLDAGVRVQIDRVALGPDLGQCCGGAVTLLREVFTAEDLQGIENSDVFARPIGAAAAMPLPVRRLLARGRAGQPVAPALIEGWMVEPVAPAPAPLWIHGAGHVGRALVDVITPLPNFVITWVDTGPERFPPAPPEGVTILPAARPADAVAHAPGHAHHLIVTHSHALDLELCHALLRHGFASAGLIGSASKWARFRRRLQALGHDPAAIGRIACPIGHKALGKHPQAIAIGVAAQLLTNKNATDNRDDDDEHRTCGALRAADP